MPIVACPSVRTHETHWKRLKGFSWNSILGKFTTNSLATSIFIYSLLNQQSFHLKINTRFGTHAPRTGAVPVTVDYSITMIRRFNSASDVTTVWQCQGAALCVIGGQSAVVLQYRNLSLPSSSCSSFSFLFISSFSYFVPLLSRLQPLFRVRSLTEDITISVGLPAVLPLAVNC